MGSSFWAFRRGCRIAERHNGYPEASEKYGDGWHSGRYGPNGAGNGRGDLGATLNRRLDRVRVIRRIPTYHPQVDQIQTVLYRCPHDHVIEARERDESAAAEVRIRQGALVNRANCRRKVERSEPGDHSPVIGRESGGDVRQFMQDFSSGYRRTFEKTSLLEGVVPANAHDEVRSGTGDALELARHVGGDMTVDGKKGHRPAREKSAQMGSSVGPGADVRTVVEDRVTQQHDRWHRRAPRFTFVPAGIGASGPES
jgi:hypothetical protein